MNSCELHESKEGLGILKASKFLQSIFDVNNMVASRMRFLLFAAVCFLKAHLPTEIRLRHFVILKLIFLHSIRGSWLENASVFSPHSIIANLARI